MSQKQMTTLAIGIALGYFVLPRVLSVAKSIKK